MRGAPLLLTCGSLSRDCCFQALHSSRPNSTWRELGKPGCLSRRFVARASTELVAEACSSLPSVLPLLACVEQAVHMPGRPELGSDPYLKLEPQHRLEAW
jgi:hypothetical protein